MGAQIAVEKQAGTPGNHQAEFKDCKTTEQSIAELPFLKLCMSCMSRTRSASGATLQTLNEYASSV